MKWTHTTVVLALVALVPAASHAKNDYEKSPGYVDFGDVTRFGDGETSVEVHLTQPILSLVEAVMKKEEPELAALINDLALVKVDVFSYDPDDAEALEADIDRVITDLKSKGWQQLIKVKEEDQRFVLYVLPTTKEREGEAHYVVSGVVVLVLGGDEWDRDNEAVFLNIVGEFDIAAIAMLVEQFDVPHMRDRDWDWDTEDLERLSDEGKRRRGQN